ncbi:hypothetical protein [Gemmata obscuriglobus]|uniref:Uncharacterized protein n=1 Tax=Gemmata obscuriglobus TaxID=114 RepID=A0A2Z3HFT0_9BACT|nr:hypothetical protein [Gemmata obscuriglobus]AWM40664.1 hypothetical protein C1280_29230 [Gemmata obscuriglobus]
MPASFSPWADTLNALYQFDFPLGEVMRPTRAARPFTTTRVTTTVSVVVTRTRTTAVTMKNVAGLHNRVYG